MHGVHEVCAESEAAAPEAGPFFGTNEALMPHPASQQRASAEHEQRDQHGDRAFVRVIASGAIIMGVIMRMVIVMAMTMIAVRGVLDMLGCSPARLAEEGEEHQPPRIEAGERRHQCPDKERKGAVAGAAGEGRFQDRVLGKFGRHINDSRVSVRLRFGVFDVIGTIASGWLTDRYDPRKLLFAYYFLRGLSLFLLPSILFATIHPSTLVFVIFYGLDWVATVPPTVVLCRQILGPEKATVIYGWVFAAHQIGGSAAAFGAAIFHTKFGDYAFAFYLSGLLCIVTAYFVLKISKVKEDAK